MKKFNSHFKQQLSELIAAIESESQVELVVIIKPCSSNYDDIALLWGLISALPTLAYLLFSENFYSEIVIYSATFFALISGLLLARLCPALQRLLINNKRKTKNTEIMARALFQKGGLHYTRSNIATLIYFSLLEQTLFIVADRSAQMALPDEQWQHIDKKLNTIFKQKNTAQALLVELKNCAMIFNHYLPPKTHKTNELADNLEIDL